MIVEGLSGIKRDLPALADGAEGERIADDGHQTARSGDGRVEEAGRGEEPEFGLGVFDVLVVALLLLVVLTRRFQQGFFLALLLLVLVDARVSRPHRAQDDHAELLAYRDNHQQVVVVFSLLSSSHFQS